MTDLAPPPLILPPSLWMPKRPAILRAHEPVAPLVQGILPGLVPVVAPRTTQFPAVAATATYNSGSSTLTNHNVTLPSGSGGLLLVGIATGIGVTHNTPSGWTLLFHGVSGDVSGHRRMSIYRREAGGTEGSTVTISLSASAVAIGISYRISGFSGAPEAADAAAGTTANPDPPSLTPTWGGLRTLWLPFIAAQNSSVPSAVPTNYSDSLAVGNSTLVVMIGSARRALQAATEDPGTFTISSSSNWVATTVAVRGA